MNPDADFIDTSPALAVIVGLVLMAAVALAFFWPSAQHLFSTFPFIAP